LPSADLDVLRRQAILSSAAGFPFLLVYGLVWIAAGALSYVVSPAVAPWLYLLGGLPATPIALAVERRVRYVPAPKPDPLLPLTLQLLFVQIVAFPAVMIVWSLAPSYTPVAFASVVGAHFLPFQWLYRTPIYGVLGVVVALGAYAVGAVSRHKAIHHTGFFVGAALLVGAFLVRAHAKAVSIDATRS